MEVKRAFALLELDENASLSQVKYAYRDLAAVWHPDRHANNPRLAAKALTRMQELNRAYEVASRHLAAGVKEGTPLPDQEDTWSESTTCPACGRPISHAENTLCRKCTVNQAKREQKKGRGPAFRASSNRSSTGRRLTTGILGAVLVILLLLVIYGGLSSYHRDDYGNTSISGGQNTPTTGGGKLVKKFQVDHFNLYEPADLVELQRNLAAIGYTVGPIDGIIGSQTLEAINRFYTDFFPLSEITVPDDVLKFAAVHKVVTTIYRDWREIAESGLLQEWLIGRNEQPEQVFANDDPRRFIRLLDLFTYERTTPAELPLPATGILYAADGGEGTELQISAPAAIRHQLIKLVDPLSGQVVLAAFIRGGQTLAVVLPAGRYGLRRVSGVRWYGKRFLFGPDTVHCSGGKGSWLEIQQAGRRNLELLHCSAQDTKYSPLSLFSF